MNLILYNLFVLKILMFFWLRFINGVMGVILKIKLVVFIFFLNLLFNFFIGLMVV